MNMSVVKTLKCWNCGASLAGMPLPISRHANCEKCFEVLHCCRMCRHYREEAHGACDHDRADPPVVKESANFCDYFKPANKFDAGDRRKATSAKLDLEALFGNEADAKEEMPDDTETDEKKKNPLDDLFGD